MRKKWKAVKCEHETWKFERTYHYKSERPIDGYISIMLQTCKKCNKLLNREVEE